MKSNSIEKNLRANVGNVRNQKFASHMKVQKSFQYGALWNKDPCWISHPLLWPLAKKFWSFSRDICQYTLPLSKSKLLIKGVVYLLRSTEPAPGASDAANDAQKIILDQNELEKFRDDLSYNDWWAWRLKSLYINAECCLLKTTLQISIHFSKLYRGANYTDLHFVTRITNFWGWNK